MGKDIPSDLFKDIIIEEIQALMLKFPERRTTLSSLESQMKQGRPYYLYNIAKRHKLKLISKNHPSKACEIEKEVCGADKVKSEETYPDKNTEEDVDDFEDDNVLDRESGEHFDVEEYDRNVAEKIRELEEDIIVKPSTQNDRTFNATIEKKIRIQRAVADLKTGRIRKIKDAALKYDVGARTLYSHIKGKVGKGNIVIGNKRKYLTREEEKHMKNRMLSLSNNGEDLTTDLVKRIFTEEFEILKINFPERKILEELQQSPTKFNACIFNFAKRHRLSELCDRQLKQERDERRVHECEVCHSAFTWKNALVTHQRTMHSFMYS